ncbi:ECF transporter S component family protein [Klebsiella quasipneumoniae]|uniref:hypothetical protein n=1 Tax=Klebsiella quasipneumoniae TaxID=1463165 RepID=UPI00387B3FBC
MHIMEGFTADVGPAWWLLFLPCLYGLVRLRRIVQEDNNQKAAAGAVRGVYFVLSALKIFRNRQLFPPDRRRPGGDSLARRGGDPGAIVLLFRALCCWRTAG